MSHHGFISVIFLAAALWSSTPAFAQDKGKLKDFGEEAKKEKKKPADDGKTTTTESTTESDDDDSFLADLIVGIVRAIVMNPVHDSLPRPPANGYSPYPYFHGNSGLFLEASEKTYSIALTGHYHYEDPTLSGGGLRLRISPIKWISGEVYLTGLRETIGGRIDGMYLSSFFLNYNLIRGSVVDVWVGAGDKMLRGTGALDGFSGNLGIEIYPAHPISLHLDLSGGTYTEVFAKLGVHIDRSEVFIGYQNFSVGRSDLAGFVAGVGVHF